MFRKRSHCWRSLMYMGNMPSRGLEDSITGDATALSFFKVFRNACNSKVTLRKSVKRDRKPFLLSFCLIPYLDQRFFGSCAQGPNSVLNMQWGSSEDGGGFWFSQTQGEIKYKDLYNHYHRTLQMITSLFFCQDVKLLTFSWLLYLFTCLNIWDLSNCSFATFLQCLLAAFSQCNIIGVIIVSCSFKTA